MLFVRSVCATNARKIAALNAVGFNIETINNFFDNITPKLIAAFKYIKTADGLFLPMFKTCLFLILFRF